MKKNKLIKSFITVSFLTGMARVLGFSRDMSLSYIYGAGRITDAFIVAFTIPSFILSLFGSSAVAVFIPLYQSNRDHRDAFTSNVLNIILLVSFIFSVVFAVFPGALVTLFATGFDAETFTIATLFARVLVWCAIPVIASEIIRGYLQVNDDFFNASSATLITHVFIIIFILFSGYFQNVMLMSFGALLGNFLCLLYLLYAAKNKHLAYRPLIDLRAPYIRQMLLLMAPVMISTIIGELNQIIDRNFASTLPLGGISSLSYASKLVSAITGFVGAAAVTTIFPTMTASSNNGEESETKRYVRTFFLNVVPIILPITAAMILLSEPIIKLLFERGAFTAEDTMRTAECMRMYAPCIIGGNLTPIIVKAFHALKNTRTPAIVAGLSLFANILFNFLLVKPFAHQGLAFATSIASILLLLLLYLALRKTMGGIGLRAYTGELIKTIAATASMSIIFVIGRKVFPMTSGDTIQTLLPFISILACGVITYAAAHMALKTDFYIMIRKLVQSAHL